MDYIINPMWFYWLQVADAVKSECIILTVIIGSILVIAAFVCGVWTIFGDNYYTDECAKLIKYIKRLVPIFIITTLCVIFVPSKRTLIEMEIAKHATYSNVESVKEQIKDATDYILDKLEGDK